MPKRLNEIMARSTQNARVFLACMLFTGNLVCVGTWIWAFLNYPIILHEPDPMIWTTEVLGFTLTILGDVYVFFLYLIRQSRGIEVFPDVK